MDVKNKTNVLNYQPLADLFDTKANSEVSKSGATVSKAVAQPVETSRVGSKVSDLSPTIKAEVDVAGIIKQGLLDRLPANIPNAIARDIGQRIPGLDRNGLPAEIGKNGFSGMQDIGQRLGIGKTIGGGLGKPGLPGLPGNGSGIEGLLGDLGRIGLPGKGKDIFGDANGGLGSGGFGGFGPGSGPAIKMPGSDRMGGASGDSGGSGGFGDPSGLGPGGFGNPNAPSPSGIGGFVNGTWDYGRNGLTGGLSGGGVSYDGYGAGVNDKGQPGVAKGDATGGSVTSPSDAGKTIDGSNDKGGGAPAGMDWNKHIKNDWVPPAGSDPKKTEGPNDLGPSNNDPSMEKKNENETAVAKNDTTKDTQAGKPNPYAQPNPEDSGGGTPRSIVGSSGLFMPNPEDTGGGTPRSRAAGSGVFMPNPEDTGGGSPRSSDSLIGRLFMPNPEDSGGGTPRSVTAKLAAKIRG